MYIYCRAQSKYSLYEYIYIYIYIYKYTCLFFNFYEEQNLEKDPRSNYNMDSFVQSIVSLTKLIVNDSLSLLVHIRSSVLISFLSEKIIGAFTVQEILCILYLNM